MKVMIVVTHLLGTGHLARALTLARAYQKANHSVTVASGGMPAPQLDRGDVPILQLPPLRSDGVNFTQLLNKAGEPVSNAGKRNTCFAPPTPRTTQNRQNPLNMGQSD